MKNINSTILLVLSLLLMACNKSDNDQSKMIPKSNKVQTTKVLHGVPLWNSAISGMSPDDILLKVKNSHWYVLLNPSNIGSQELVRINNYTWLGERYTASFYFHSCQLSYITLNSKNQLQSFDASMEKSPALMNELTKEYGTPLKEELPKYEFRVFKKKWRNNKVNVDMSFVEISDSPAAIQIRFSPAYQKNFTALKLDPNNQNCWPTQSVIDSLYPKPKPYGPNNPPPPEIKLISPPPPASVIKQLNDQKL